MIVVSIDLRLIDQSRCKKITRKNGEPATFCDLTLIETPNSDYGDYMCKQSISKEERQARVEMPILGNGRNIGKSTPKPRSKQEPIPAQFNEDDEIPF